LIRRNFRLWWQVPRDLADRPQHRQVTFLELFYDLVYVVLIAELTHSVASNLDGRHLA
jgi:low temperature requirement protein LtrA